MYTQQFELIPPKRQAEWMGRNATGFHNWIWFRSGSFFNHPGDTTIMTISSSIYLSLQKL